MSVNSSVFFSPPPQVGGAESLFTPAVGFVEAFRALSREMREERDLEQYDVSHFARRSESAISKWESGETKQPDELDNYLDGYAKAFGMPTTELIAAIARRMGEDVDPSEVERELTAGYPEPGKERSASARRRGASRSRKASG